MCRIISPVIVDFRSNAGKWYRNIHIKDLKLVPKNRLITDDNMADDKDATDDEATREGSRNINNGGRRGARLTAGKALTIHRTSYEAGYLG